MTSLMTRYNHITYLFCVHNAYIHYSHETIVVRTFMVAKLQITTMESYENLWLSHITNNLEVF
jgi:hypothetical protein